jgi:hypothetical protein
MKSEMQRKPTSQTKTTVPKESRAPKADAAKPKLEAAKPKATPTRDDIAMRAYEIYVARGKADGRETEDWAQAERELLGAHHRNN